MSNLSDNQKVVLKQLVKWVCEGELDEEFQVLWGKTGGFLVSPKWKDLRNELKITPGVLDALMEENLLRCRIKNVTTLSTDSQKVGEDSRRCTLTKKAYDAVASNFDALDTSSIPQSPPLAASSNLDEKLRKRCLPLLTGGAADPTLWDSVVRTAGVILEERLREIGGITDPNQIGQALVNEIFSNRGTLASKFSVDSERQGYRDLFAGVVGVFRNPSAHRLLDPSPETGEAIVVFINLLLKKLEELRTY